MTVSFLLKKIEGFLTSFIACLIGLSTVVFSAVSKIYNDFIVFLVALSVCVCVFFGFGPSYLRPSCGFSLKRRALFETF